MGISIAGTLALFIIVVGFRDIFSVNGYVCMAVFPVVLVASIYGWWSKKSRSAQLPFFLHCVSFVAFTDKRLIVATGTTHIVEYKTIIAVTIEMNYLHCRHEMKIEREGKPKVFNSRKF